MTRKFGGVENVAAIHDRLRQAGEAEGLDFAFDRIMRSVNTLDAHRLLRWAGQAGVQDAMKEALFRAYFTEGRDIGRTDVLAEIAGTIELDGAAVAARLRGEEDRPAVREDIETAIRIGVSGVPFFIFAQSFAVSGAQGAAVLAQAIDRARDHLDNPRSAVLSA